MVTPGSTSRYLASENPRTVIPEAQLSVNPVSLQPPVGGFLCFDKATIFCMEVNENVTLGQQQNMYDLFST